MRTLVVEEFKRIEKLLAVFHQGMLQNFFTFLTVLEKNDVTLRDVRWYLEEVKKIEGAKVLEQVSRSKVSRKMTEEQEKWKSKVGSCPLCGKSLGLDKVSAAKGNANVYGYRGVWRCPGEECLFEEFTTEYPEVIYDRLMGR